MKLLRSVLLLATASVALPAPSDYLEVTALLPKGVAREDSRLTLFLDGSATAISCTVRGPSSDGLTSFVCPVTRGARYGRFRFELPGFKPFTVNQPILRTGSEVDEIKLGELNAVPSEEPRIENIVLASGADGTMRFQITVNNRSKRQVLIKGIQLSGTNEHDCAFPTEPIYFKLSKQLRFTPATSGKTAITGIITEAGDLTDYSFKLTGTGIFERCGHSEFSLSASVNFPIPENYFKIELVVPVSGNHDSNWTRITKSSDGKPMEAPTSEVLKKFDRIHFTLTTSDRDFTEIKSYYETN